MKMSNKFKPLVTIQCYEDRQQTLPLRKQDGSADGHTNCLQQPKPAENAKIPPPPPPMPILNGHANNETKKEENLNPTPKAIITDLNKIINIRNGTLKRTPTPDYNNKTDNSETKINNNDKAELESLESYKLKNPSNLQPKPPSNYFVKAPNGTATMKKLVRPVSVTIGEYGVGGRREPAKLDFLNGDKPDGPQSVDDVSISNRLQSELALTLSRSNLRKKTEALKNRPIANGSSVKDVNSNETNEDTDSSLDKNFRARYGNNLLPLPPSVTIPKVAKMKQ